MKTKRSLTHCLVALCLSLIALRIAGAEESTPSAQRDVQSDDVFAPYAFLIGEWDVRAEDNGPVVAVTRIRWGPNHSYIWYSGSLIFGGHEEPHLEGLLIWNGVHKNLDMLFSMDLKTGRVQEQGTLFATADSSLVRDITAVYSAGAHPIGAPTVGSAGATAHFRETYKRVGSDKVLTSAMRETDHGWVATFPGSDHLVMMRRSRS